MSHKMRTYSARCVLLAATILVLGGCATDSGSGTTTTAGGVVIVPTPTPSPTPAPTPSPTPATTPTPTPVPTPTATLSGVLDEGDSISLFGIGNHTGMYAAAHPGIPFYGRAVGGSGITQMLSRYDADAVFNPKVVAALIGANDVYAIGNVGFPYATEQQYLDALFAWAAKWRAKGTKVAIGTVMSLCIPSNPNNANVNQNIHRAGVNAGLRAAVGTKIDAVIDYAADPIMGPDTATCNATWFPDGVHPSPDGQARMATIYSPVVDRLLQ